MSEAQPAPPVAPGSRRRLAASAVGLAALAGVAGGLVVHATDDRAGFGSRIVAAANGTRCPAVTIADAVLPSVVTIEIRTATGSSNGSGEVVRDNGYILTNDHVISPAGTGGTIDVLFSSGRRVRAKLIGRAPQVDLAVVKVDEPEKLPTITIGRSETLRVGQPVVALGAPLGLSGSVTSGIVSALGRDVPVPAENGRTALLPGAVQTDASINPGNSGGPLVDCGSRLVGVNTAIATVPNAAGQAGGGSVGIGFAIPVDLATRVADELIATGRFSDRYLGMSTLPISAEMAGRFNATEGLFVQAVSPSGPAAQAGIRVGDVITHVDGRATTGPDSIFIVTLTKKVGDRVRIDYVRDGKPASTTATVAEQP